MGRGQFSAWTGLAGLPDSFPSPHVHGRAGHNTHRTRPTMAQSIAFAPIHSVRMVPSNSTSFQPSRGRSRTSSSTHTHKKDTKKIFFLFVFAFFLVRIPNHPLNSNFLRLRPLGTILTEWPASSNLAQSHRQTPPDPPKHLGSHFFL